MVTKSMTKTDLVAGIAATAGIERAAAARVLSALAEIVSREIAGGGAVTLPGLGKFSCRTRPDRIARNPRTGEEIAKPSDRAAKVTIARPLRDAVAS